MGKPSTRRICVECNCPQFPSPSGWVCENGHGGAEYELGPVEDYERQYREWFGRIRAEIRARA